MFPHAAGYPPFHDADQKQLYKKICKGAYAFHDKYWSGVSAEAKDLISRMLTVNALDRITAEQALQHPWLQKSDAQLEQSALGGALGELKKFQAGKKLRAGVKAVMAINKMNRIMGSLGVMKQQVLRVKA